MQTSFWIRRKERNEMFKTRYDAHDRTETPVGSRIAPTYTLSERNELKQTGEKDLYAEIQSHAESCDIKMLLQRLDLGDNSMIRVSQFMDITDMPSTLAEAYNMIRNATQDFNALPLEIRKEYDFSAEEYIKDLGSEKWRELVAKKAEKQEEKKVEEKKDEQE